jgi:lysophospholipase L1-like esterase
LRRILTAAVLASAAALAGCAAEAPPVSEKVQQYYDQNIASAKASLPAVAELPTAAFIGDSYSQGTGASNQGTRWTALLSRQMGWAEENFARGGTGYLIEAKPEQCGKDACPNYAAMIPEVVASKPDLVIVAGGRNDSGLPKADRDAAIVDFFAALRGALPNTPIAVVSPLWDASKPSFAMGEIAEAVRMAAAQNNVTYLEVGQPLSGHPEWIAKDGVHPLDAGYSAIAEAVKTEARKVPALTAVAPTPSA